MKGRILIFGLILMMSMSMVSAWMGSYASRIPINCSNSDDTPIMIGGSDGIELDSIKQVIWTKCQSGIYLYFTNSTIYAIGNDSSPLPFEVEKGGGESYNPSDLWENYLLVMHLSESCADSSPNNLGCVYHGDMLNSTGSDCAFGDCFTLDGQGANYIEVYSEPYTSFGTSNFSVEFFGIWNPQGSNYPTYLSTSTLSGGWRGFHFETDSANPRFKVNLMDDEIILNDTTRNTLHYWAFSRPGTFINNGESDIYSTTGNTDTTNVINGANLLLGRNPDATYPRPGTGTIDEVRIGYFPLTEPQVRSVNSNLNNVLGYGSLGAIENLTICTPEWECDLFSSCVENVSSCLSVHDLNDCGESFGGNISSFDEACVMPIEPDRPGILPLLIPVVLLFALAWYVVFGGKKN